MINLEGIKLRQGGFNLRVDRLSLEKGSLIAVMGNNGSGKSTFLTLLSGLKSFTGIYTLDGQSFNILSRQWFSKKVGFLLQQTSVNMPFDVFYVVLTGRFVHTDGTSYTEKDFNSTERVLKLLDIEHLKDRPINELSGGERQRVFLARVINMDTQVLLLDEPFSGVDMAHQIAVMDVLKKVSQDKIVLVVIHDISFAVTHFKRFLFFKQGALVYDFDHNNMSAHALTDVFGVNIMFFDYEGRRFVYADDKG